ncbi:MAG: pyruvate kinase [Clostridium sp.]|uniref:pyruvate kinase n=1 Tax=Clostridium sp. TaxID=1506 RepID=UPI00302014B9
MKKTKIICTMGPTTNDKEIVKKLIENGMNAGRLNFSHGSHEEHKVRIDMIKEVREELQKPIAIVLDTKGPEIRTGNFENGTVELKEGTTFTVHCGEDIIGNENKCSITYKGLYMDVKPGDKLLINDGLVALNVKSIDGKNIKTIVENTGVIGNHKGMNVPGVALKLPALTEKDIADLKFGIECEVDIVAASFIRKGTDVLDIRKLLDKNGGDYIQIFSKIENRQGVDNIDEIIRYSDGIMVARGDLGVEIPTEEVPVVQKMIIEKCNIAGKPVITATQMLDSMIRNPRPTRAEASDVANAIFDGTDAIMLSGETANGKYPVEVVKTMAQIAIKAEQYINYEENFGKRKKVHVPNVPNAISVATCNTAMELNASAIITATQSGQTARQISKYRPECTIIACTPYEKVARSLALNWGVLAILTPKFKDTDELIEKTSEIALASNYVEKGDLVVIVAGIPMNYVGSTNMMKVHIIGDILLQGKGSNNGTAYGTALHANSPKDIINNMDENQVIIVDKLGREYVNVLEDVSGIIVESDEMSSSVVLECNSRNIPIIYNATGATEIIKSGCFITMDSKVGMVYSGKTNV